MRSFTPRVQYGAASAAGASGATTVVVCQSVALTFTLRLRSQLILYNVGFEHLAVLAPAGAVKAALVEAVGGCPSHVQCVVRVVVREKALTAEGQQVFKTAQPLVNAAEVALVIALVNRVGLSQLAAHNPQYAGGYRQTGARQRLADQLPQIGIAQLPFPRTRVSRQFRAQHRAADRLS